jgi:hypothetical protein
MKSHINFELEELSRSGVFQLFLHVHDRMADIYRKNDQITEHEWRLAVAYNRLLREYEPAYDAASDMSDPAHRGERLRLLGRQVAEELGALAAKEEEAGSKTAGTTSSDLAMARAGGA